MSHTGVRGSVEPLELSSLIGGATVSENGSTFSSSDPWTGETVAIAHAASAKTVAAAAKATASVELEFAALPWTERATLLERTGSVIRGRADLLAGLVVREVGKPIAEARAEVTRVQAVLDYYAQEGRRAKGSIIPAEEAGVAILTRRRPIGTIAVITPWNFPIAIAAWKIAPALLCGNPVLWKPSSAAIACADALTHCFIDAGFPPDSLGLVIGGSATADLLLGQAIAAVSFTGSTEVGHRIRQSVAARGVRVQLELGGKNVAIVLADADPSAAAAAIARAAYGYAGQKCTATSLVLAEPSIAGVLEDALCELTRRAPWGDPADPNVWGGPVINTTRRQAIDELVERSRANGAEILAVGRQCHRPTTVAPTFIRAPSRDIVVAHEEVFGPVLTLLPTDKADALITAANGTRYGLAASIFGKDIDQIRLLCNRLEVGIITINRMSTGLEVQAPSSGWKSSGSGEPEQGTEVIHFLTKSQTIYWKSALAGAEFP